MIFSIATWLDIIESSVIGFISDNFYSTALVENLVGVIFYSNHNPFIFALSFMLD
ncbi:hypothetical protein GYW21_08240 [Lactobacillus mellis]|nr:hypothetical protein [Bombilactobacillus mellis]